VCKVRHEPEVHRPGMKMVDSEPARYEVGLD